MSSLQAPDGSYNHHIGYSCINGRMRNTLLGVSVALTDSNSGDGGFCILRGSHKSNFPCPNSIAQCLTAKEYVDQPIVRAGDVLLFSEGTTHGTLPWKPSDRERRVVLYRLAPPTTAYARAYIQWPPSYLEDMTDSQVTYITGFRKLWCPPLC